MSRRAVLRLTEWSQDIGNFEAFFAIAKEVGGVGPRAKVHYAVDEDGHPIVYIELPERASEALERKERPPVRTKTQQAVRDQLEDRQKAIASGDAVPGHVPPAVKKKKNRLVIKK